MKRNILKQSFAWILTLAYAGQLTAGVAAKAPARDGADISKTLSVAFDAYNVKHDEAKVFQDLKAKGIEIDQTGQKFLINEIQTPAPKVSWNNNTNIMTLSFLDGKTTQNVTLQVKGTKEKPELLVNNIAIDVSKIKTMKEFKTELVKKLTSDSKTKTSSVEKLLNLLFPVAYACDGDCSAGSEKEGWFSRNLGWVTMAAGALTAAFMPDNRWVGIGIMALGAGIQIGRSKQENNPETTNALHK